MIAHRNAIVSENVDLLGGLFASADYVLCLFDLFDPTLFDCLVEVMLNLRIFEIFGIRIKRTDGGIPLLVGAVLLESVEASCSLLCRLGHRFLEVTSCRGDSPDECDCAGVAIIEDNHSCTCVEIGDDRREVYRESICTRELLHTVTHLSKSLCPTGS